MPHLRNKNKAALLDKFLQTNLFLGSYSRASIYWRSALCLFAERVGAIGWAWGVGSGTLRFEEGTASAVEQLREKPATAIWGMRDPTLMAKYLLPLFQESFPDAPISCLTQASHYLYEDAPETIGLLIRQFIELTRAI